MEAAFLAAREILVDSVLLDHLDAAAELALVTDASASHMGAVLQQWQRGQLWRPLGFYSKMLSQAEAKYSAFDRELLAVYSAIIHFQHFVEGRNVAVFMDHKPLFRPQVGQTAAPPVFCNQIYGGHSPF
jgi:RNase H-like domain found in reverse transcriptase